MGHGRRLLRLDLAVPGRMYVLQTGVHRSGHLIAKQTGNDICTGPCTAHSPLACGWTVAGVQLLKARGWPCRVPTRAVPLSETTTNYRIATTNTVPPQNTANKTNQNTILFHDFLGGWKKPLPMVFCKCETKAGSCSKKMELAPTALNVSKYCVSNKTDMTSRGVAPSTCSLNSDTELCNPLTIALRCRATPTPLKYRASASASAALTCRTFSLSAL